MKPWEAIRRRCGGGMATFVLGVFAMVVLAGGGEALGCCGKCGPGIGPSAAITSGSSVGPSEDFAHGEPQVEALWKLGRGFHNLAFGMPAELLHNPAIEASKADTVFGFGAGVTEGVLVGLGKGAWRMGAGFLDIVTFPVAADGWYDPEILPPYPF